MDGLQATGEVLSGPFGAVLVVVALACVGALRGGELFRHRGTAILGALLVLVAGLSAVATATRVALRQPTLAAAELSAPGDSLDIPPLSDKVAIVVYGALPPIAQGESASGRYTLAVWDGDERVFQRSRVFEESWRQRRITRGVRMPVLTVDAEDRFDVPESVIGHALSVRLDRLEGDIVGPLHADAVPAPPAPTLIVVVGVVLTLLGSAVDGVEASRTSVSLYVGFLAAFSAALLEGVSPTSSRWAIAGPLFLGLLFGVPAGWWLRMLVAWPMARLRRAW